MLIEPVELTLSHVALGRLSEVALLELFATTQAHALTQDTGHTLRDVRDADGALLYPGYFWLHLRVPATAPLERFGLWDRCEVGVDVRRWGRLLLDSTYALGAPGQLASAPALDTVPSMRAASLWVADGTAQPASPRDGAIAVLAPAASSPAAIDGLRRMRVAGTFGHGDARRHAPIAYDLKLDRDLAPGHNPMFATYVRIMECAEQTLLGENAWPALPLPLLEHRRLLEREVFFFEPAGPARRVLVDLSTRFVRCASDAHGPDTEHVTAGALDATYELYDAGSKVLLACARARKLFVVPRGRAQLASDLVRFVDKGESDAR